MGPFVVVNHPDGTRAAIHYSSILAVEECLPHPGAAPKCQFVVRAGNEVRTQAALITLEEALALIEKARAYDLGTLVVTGDVLA